MSGRDIVLTGLPRSGTTLACELLNTVADTVALDEPMDTGPWLGRPAFASSPRLSRWARGRRKQVQRGEEITVGADTFADLIQRFYDESRASLLSGKGALSKTVGGKVSGRKFGDERSASGFRKAEADIQRLQVTKPLDDDFTLVVKHNTRFAAMLPVLVTRFPAFAIVRNPLAMLASWQTVELPIRHGRGAMAVRVDADLRTRLDALSDVVDRQFVLLEWYFARYRDNLDRSHVIRYEDLIATGGAALQTITPHAATLHEPLEGRNRAEIYDHTLMTRLGERLLDTDGAWWDHYTRDDVTALMAT